MRRKDDLRGTVGRRRNLGPVELVLVCLLSMGVLAASQMFSLSQGRVSPSGRVAAEIMLASMERLRAHRSVLGPPMDLGVDINETGLIGVFFSPMTTTVGNLEAKRTTTNPNMAAVLVDLLEEAGVREGDFVAVGASGSFPALILAVVSAAEALDLHAGVIVSLGSSQFGANLPELTWLEMERIIAGADSMSTHVIAASLGGDLDVARDLDRATVAQLTEKIETAGIPFIHEPDLASNVSARIQHYRAAADGARMAAFVNIGGAWANLGIDPSVLSIAPGLVQFGDLPSDSDRGVVHAMAVEGVPVIHLLNVRDLAQQFGLPWDPSPLPAPGEPIAGGRQSVRKATPWLTGPYLLVIAAWLGWVRWRRR